MRILRKIIPAGKGKAWAAVAAIGAIALLGVIPATAASAGTVYRICDNGGNGGCFQNQNGANPLVIQSAGNGSGTGYAIKGIAGTFHGWSEVMIVNGSACVVTGVNFGVDGDLEDTTGTSVCTSSNTLAQWAEVGGTSTGELLNVGFSNDEHKYECAYAYGKGNTITDSPCSTFNAYDNWAFNPA